MVRSEIKKVNLNSTWSFNMKSTSTFNSMIRKLLIALLAGLSLAAFAQPVSFAPKVDYPVGTAPREIEVADFDGDGHLDIATSNSQSSSISILKGTGTGCFGAPQNFPADPNIFGLAVADLNGDGKADLVAANKTGSNTVSVFINNGTGFLPRVDYSSGILAVGSGSITLSIGDINADNKPDLVVVNDNTPNGSIAILTGNGDGTFNPKVEYTTNIFPYSVAIGDVDGDGFADLAVANPFTNSVSIFINDAFGGFPIETPYLAGNFCDNVKLFDFNSDGHLDIAVTNDTDNTIGLFTNNGLGVFSAMTAFPSGSATGTSSLRIFDMNSDGITDIISSYVNSGLVGVILGDGLGGFGPAQTFATGNVDYDVNIGDFDEDGNPDIASANYSDNTVSVLLTSSNTCGPPPTITNFTPTSGPVGATVTINGTNFSTTTTDNIVYFGATRATVTSATATQLVVEIPVGATYQPITVNVNGLTAYSDKPFTVTFPCGGDIDANSFSPKVDFTTGTNPYDVAIQDVDGDGKADIVLVSGLTQK